MPRLKPPLRACMTATSSTSMRCGWAIGAGATAWFLNGCTTAASGLFGSSAGARADGIIGFGMPDGGGTDVDGGGTGVSDGPPARMGGGIAGAGTLPTPGGGGVAAPGPPIFWRRDFRSILGFLSSAIVDRRDLTCPDARMSTRQRTVAPGPRPSPARG